MAEASTAKSPDQLKKRRIKYATGGEEAVVRPGAAIETHPGADIPWRENPDNPMSPDYVPVATRNENAKARWWAKHTRRKNATNHGVY